MRLIIIFAAAALFFSGVLAQSNDNHLSSEFTLKFRQDVLSSHNVYRARHGQSPLRLNAELTEMAQREAERSLRLKHFDFNPNLVNRGQPLGRSNAQGWSTFAKEFTGKYLAFKI
jgi:uncharacterized protein YkwD